MEPGEVPIYSPRNWKVAVFSFLNKWTKVEVVDLLNLVYNRYMFQRDILFWVTNLPKIIELVSRKDGIEQLATWFLSSPVWIHFLLLYIIIDAKHPPETFASTAPLLCPPTQGQNSRLLCWADPVLIASSRGGIQVCLPEIFNDWCLSHLLGDT